MSSDVNSVCWAFGMRWPNAYDKLRYLVVSPRAFLCDETCLSKTAELNAPMRKSETDGIYFDHFDDLSTDLATG